MHEQTEAWTAPDEETGLVCKKSVGQYWVHAGGRTIECAISNMLRKQLIYPIADPTSFRRRVMEVRDIRQVDPVAVGDLVRVHHAGDGTGLITEVLPRRSKLVRKAAGTKPLEQVIVANVDQIVAIVAAAQPRPNWELLDRYLAAAEWLELPALIVITKIDLVSPDLLAEEVDNYRHIGYEALLTSIVDGAGLTAFRTALAERTSVLIGASGVGKTSLLNAIQPGLGLRVGEVSRATNKGKHTTTHPELFPLEFGGSLVDTPGMREFGLWEVQGAELADAFPEMRPYVGRCRFGLDCSHTHEPGCAIKAGVEDGQIAERRYHSYLQMQGRDGAAARRR
jgi:ribosome biogenesis GTPase